MNRLRVIIVLLLVCRPMDLRAASLEVEEARQRGALGRVTLRVVDARAVPVEDADIDAGFYNPHQRGQVVKGRTDTNGCYVATGTPVQDMRYTITKDGYYTTEGDHVFCRYGQESPLRDGRWQPWNPTNTVVLKEHRNPIPMCAKRVDTLVPIRDSPVGFDLEVGDWVVPNGCGVKPDILFAYRAEIEDYWTGRKELTIAGSNERDGFCRSKKDMWSVFVSAYEAKLHGYDASLNLVLDATKDKVLESRQVDKGEYVLCRVRTVLDDEGKIITAHYGKIYGPIRYGSGKNLDRLRFTYYFNPTPNDRNVEFDPSRNLLDVERRAYRP